MKKRLSVFVLLAVIIGVVGGTAVVAFANNGAENVGVSKSDEYEVIPVTYTDEIPKYNTNENGLTYGNVNPLVSPEKQELPQLIAAIGIDEVEGYVYESDLNGKQPNNPEEALIYMKELEAEIATAKAAGEEYLRYIPLYESDGVTVIGKFGISYPDNIE